MSIAWLTPAALWGLALVLLPIAVHLLARQHARVLLYPSLRFLRHTQLASFRRRTIEDALLLACRIATVVVAALALAAPVLITPSRQASYDARIARAVVLVPPVTAESASALAEGAFAYASFQRDSVADALADAAGWLNRQPRAAREIVITGALHRGAITEGELNAIAPDIGVRFEPVLIKTSADVTMPIVTRRDGALVRLERRVQLDLDSTRVRDGSATPVAGDLITIVAPVATQPLADAALATALDAGVPWSDFSRRVAIVWEGGDEPKAGFGSQTHVIRMAVPSPPATAAGAVSRALERVSPVSLTDPVSITPAQLSDWSRPAGAPSANAPVADEGDRRWLWALALVLLGLEAWLRRQRSVEAADAVNRAEGRVA